MSETMQKFVTRCLVVVGLLAANVMLAERLAASTRFFDDKGHCSSNTCVNPCDYMHHFCICSSNSDCKIGDE